MLFKYSNYLRVLLCLLFSTNSSGLHAQSATRSIATVKKHAGVPSLYINDTLAPPFAYMSYLGETQYYKEVAAAGIHLYNIPAYLGDRGINSASGIGPFRAPLWIGKDRFDYSSIIRDFNEILAADPQAKVVIRLHLDPPVWWEKEHPESTALLPDGSTFRTTFSSETWKSETTKVFQTVLQWLLCSRYSSHLIGIHVAGGFTEEWFYHFKDHFYDLNPTRTKAFQQWLKKKYKKEALLQKSWATPQVTFNTAQPADISGKVRRPEWRDSKLEQHYIDTFQFHSETMADNIIHFCQVVKTTSKGKLLTGAFYGYHYFVNDPRRGHGALTKLLTCPELDYLSSPNDYNRVIGEDWPPMVASQSLKLHGKLWLAENDTRTSITTLLKDRAPRANPPGQKYEGGVWAGPPDMETSVSFLWKNLGRMLSQGYGGWWFDMWGGWFSDPQLLAVLQKGQEFYTNYPPVHNPLMDAQVGVIVDEQLTFWDASYGDLSGKILANRYSLGKTGSPYDLLLRADLDRTDQYKVIWLMGFLQLTEKEQQKVKEWQKKGVLVLWTNGNGTQVFDSSAQPTHLADKLRWSESELRELWKKSGVHCYSESGDVLYAGRNWISIHTVEGGKRTIKLPFSANIINPVTNNSIETNTTSFEVDLAPNTTTLYTISNY
jgi:beta-galactosidase